MKNHVENLIVLKMYLGELASIVYILLYSFQFTLSGMGLRSYDESFSPISETEKSKSLYVDYEPTLIVVEDALGYTFLFLLICWVLLYYKYKDDVSKKTESKAIKNLRDIKWKLAMFSILYFFLTFFIF